MLFDDINGDDSCQQYPSGIHVYCSPGVPFVDIIGNGVRDSTLAYHPRVVKCVQWRHGPDSAHLLYRTYQYEIQDSTYQFLSDSGVTYTSPPYIVPLPTDTELGLRITDSGLAYVDELFLHLLDTGAIREVTGEKVFVCPYRDSDPTGDEPLLFEKSVYLDQSLDVWDVHYDNLFLVRYVYPTDFPEGAAGSPPFFYYEFYFS